MVNHLNPQLPHSRTLKPTGKFIERGKLWLSCLIQLHINNVFKRVECFSSDLLRGHQHLPHHTCLYKPCILWQTSPGQRI